MKRLLPVIMVLSLFTFFMAGCSKPAEVLYYPRAHFTVMYTNLNMDGYLSLDWGTKLVYRGLTTNISKVTVTKKNEELTSNFTLIAVMNPLTKDKGYVLPVSVISNPISRAVLLKSAICYGQPRTATTDQSSVDPFVLMYITETNDSGWAKIVPFNNGYYSISNKNFPNKSWMQLSDLSTSESDVDFAVFVQLSLGKFKYLNSYQKNNTNYYDKTTNDIVVGLKNLINQSPNSGVVILANQLIDMIIPPAVMEEPGEGDGESTSVNEEEL